MAEALSQSEIDALVSAYKETGGKEMSQEAEKEVRLYDFARPDKFSKEHLKSLNIIHSKHGASFAVSLASKLRTPIQVDLLAVDQLTYREYCASVPDGTLFAEVSLDPLTATAIFEFNPALACACVDLLAGGTTISGIVGELTEIDKRIMRQVLDLALKKYTEAWSACVAFTPNVVAVSTDNNSRQILLPSEAVLVCGYEVSIGECVSMMSICIPAAAVEAVLPALTLGRTLNAQGRRFDSTSSIALRKAFDDVQVECHALLGSTELSLNDIASLQVGDLICLPKKADAQAELWIENVLAFSAVPGLAGKNLALKIAKTLEKPFGD